MRTLTVKRFSCISEATLTIAPITLLVGPQASGKSILCKLSYFFVSLLGDQVTAIAERTSHEDFIKQSKVKFIRWFTNETWGSQKFELSFNFGTASIDISRTISKGKAGKGVNVRFSEVLRDHYTGSLSRLEHKSANKSIGADSTDFTFGTWNLERSIREDLRKSLGDEYVSSQIFIPAARSFFTSIGRAIAAFESSNILDPLTLLFGRMYASRGGQFHPETPNDRAIHALLKTATTTMLGGKLIRERDREVLRTTDGRVIPLSALSSGQQELFPLLRVLPQGAIEVLEGLSTLRSPKLTYFQMLRAA